MGGKGVLKGGKDPNRLAMAELENALCRRDGQDESSVCVNNIREATIRRAVTANDPISGKHLLLRNWKKECLVPVAK